jgi:hypothetical protein
MLLQMLDSSGVHIRDAATTAVLGCTALISRGNGSIMQLSVLC